MTGEYLLIGLISITVLLIIAKLAIVAASANSSGVTKNAVIEADQAHDNDLNEPGYTFPDGIKAGNIQDIGDRDFQSSYFAIVSSATDIQAPINNEANGINQGQMNGNSLLAIIADGINDNKPGKLAAVLAVETMKHNFNIGLHKAFSTEDFFEESFRQMQKSFSDNIDINKYGVKLAAVIADGGFLNYAAIGDCVIYLYRDKELIALTKGYEKRMGSIALCPKDIVILLNQGAFENLTEMEIIWYLDLDDHPQEKCQALLKRARSKRVQQGNSVIVMLEGLQTVMQMPKKRLSLPKA